MIGLIVCGFPPMDYESLLSRELKGASMTIKKDLVERLRNWADEDARGPFSHFKDVQVEAADEIERLTRLLSMRPPYYCHQCHCASCGNTFKLDSLERT